MTDYVNTNDYALATGTVTIIPYAPTAVSWEANQEKYKPDNPQNYNVVGTNCYYGPAEDIDLITNTFQIMAFCARPRSKAVGAQLGVNGVIEGGYVDLHTNYGFNLGSDQHSAEFNWPIQQVGGFYHQLLNTLIPP